MRVTFKEEGAAYRQLLSWDVWVDVAVSKLGMESNQVCRCDRNTGYKIGLLILANSR